MEKTILIVDDAAPVRKLLASALSKRGYSVTTAESAHVALEKLQENYFHVMFIDLQAEGIRHWSEGSTWHGLEIIAADGAEPEQQNGTVEFIAHYT